MPLQDGWFAHLRGGWFRIINTGPQTYTNVQYNIILSLHIPTYYGADGVKGLVQGPNNGHEQVPIIW